MKNLLILLGVGTGLFAAYKIEQETKAGTLFQKLPQWKALDTHNFNRAVSLGIFEPKFKKYVQQ